MMNSQKHAEFVNEPMVDKSVRDIPGIGKQLGRKLRHHGFRDAEDVFEKFKRLDEVHFKHWLRTKIGADARGQNRIYCAMRDWRGQFL